MLDYAQLIDHLSIGVVVLDAEMRIVFWNRWMEEHSMLARADVLGATPEKLFPSLARKGFVRKAAEVLQSGRPVFFTHKVHQSMFPFPTPRSYVDDQLALMQQTVILSPIKNAEHGTTHVLVSVFDISDWVAHQDQLIRSKKELERLSLVDELTQIYNRRAIMEKLQDALLIHERKQRKLSIAMIDIDHFKGVNDRHGHQCGDQILYEVAQLLMEGLRGYDSIGRYGGEEFMLILPETAWEEAARTCERLRQSVADRSFYYSGKVLRLTISIGVATLEVRKRVNADELVRRADSCLYRAKSAGRNIVVAEEARLESF